MVLIIRSQRRAQLEVGITPISGVSSIYFIALVFVCFWITPLFAQDRADHYSEEISLQALHAEGWEIASAPEGKKIRSIYTIRLPVFLRTERLGWLTAPLNLLHVTTQEALVLKEARVKKGGLWSSQDALETERNLRQLGVFTSVRVFAVHAIDGPPHPDEVDVVVVTRDLWSLRLENAFSYNGGVLSQLSLALTERNLLGRRITLSASSNLSPLTFSAGLSVSHRRFGPDLSLGIAAAGIWTRATGEREGEGIEITLSRPLYHLDQRWSFGASAGIGRVRARITRGGQVVTDDDPSTPELEETPIEWSLRSWSAGASATRQWKGEYQKKLSLGVSISESQREMVQALSDSQLARWRELYLPPDRFQVGPSVSFTWFQREFIALHDISTFGVREDLRVGPSISTSHSLVLIGDQAYIPSFSLGYTWRLLNRGFIAVGFSGSTRIEGKEREKIRNRELSGGLTWALPLKPTQAHLGFLIGRSSWLSRWNDVSNAFSSIGGSSGLRGYPDGAFSITGGDVARQNLEYRSPPLKWSFLHLGAVLFYDGASVHSSVNSFAWKQSVGGGLRFLFPQLNRSVFRLDLATPLSPYPENQARPGMVFSFGSAQGFAVMPWEG